MLVRLLVTRLFVLFFLPISVATECLLGPVAADESSFASAWSDDLDRPWLGESYWSKPLESWQVREGRIECHFGRGRRTVNLLTREMTDQAEPFEVRVQVGKIAEGGRGWAGFTIGSDGAIDDYRHASLFGQGIDAGVMMDGRLFIGSPPDNDLGPKIEFSAEGVELVLRGEPVQQGYRLTLSACRIEGGAELASLTREGISVSDTVGNVALVCFGGQQRAARCWFSHWKIEGAKFQANADRAWGPILWAMYTVSRDSLKMTAQMAPMGDDDNRTVTLEMQTDEGWKEVAQAESDRLSCTASLRVENIDETVEIPYRLTYRLKDRDRTFTAEHYEGVVRRAPPDETDFVVAGFTGNYHYAFPNLEVVAGATHHDPDLLFFSGDQIYEAVGGYGVVRQPLEPATLSYLGKWYLFGWAFGDLMRNRLTVCIPDDHDVYQPNIWGQGGRHAEHDHDGGYTMDPQWVNMVQRTQTSHLPDPVDPDPIEQGITVYFTDLVWGGVSFAILEDRKFKTGPKGFVPPTNTNRPDHIRHPAPDFDPADSDLPGAVLLGERQLQFLEDWSADWRGCEMKVALSQTTFASVASLHGNANYRLVADYDANGWPQTGRNEALSVLRRGFAFMLCGDTHLPTMVHHGIDDWEDAGVAFCVPSIAAGYPRSWAPLHPGENRDPGAPDYTGRFLDGFGNRMTVYAAANPQQVVRGRIGDVQLLHEKSSGYGIVRLDREARTITIECWPILSDPSDDSQQFTGWPRTIDQAENAGRKPVGYLPRLEVKGLDNAVVQIIDDETDEVVYTLRIAGNCFRPMVFSDNSHTLRVGDPERDVWQVREGMELAAEDAATIHFEFDDRPGSR